MERIAHILLTIRICMLQCGHDHSVMERSRSTKASMRDVGDGFNVAMTIQSWKVSFHRMIENSSKRCFNVAMTIQSWKVDKSRSHAAGTESLQCGHDHSVMESRMARCKCRSSASQLQCGHDHSVMERIHRGRLTFIRTHELQCGHDHSVMER